MRAPAHDRKVVVVGAGGREHALAWKISLSSAVAQVIVAPGNDGMDTSWTRWPLDLSSSGKLFPSFARQCAEEKVDLVVIGPDGALADGLVDELTKVGVRAFGPTRAAAKLEWSKSFAKEVMVAAGVPTARYWKAETPEQAREILEAQDWSEGRGWVLKSDGLALGKGVSVCSTLREARTELERISSIGHDIVIEERLSGSEISWFAFCDGEQARLFEPAQDHKRLLDQDQGPNTGGMGAFSPVPGVPASWTERVEREIFAPVLKEMKKRGTPFRGLLYAGLMVDYARDQIWVIEFNARFGDPETQVLMSRFEGDLLPWLEACADGSLSDFPKRVPFSPQSSVVVVAAAPGYPEHPEKGSALSGPPLKAPDVFVSGLSRRESGWLTSGGRVFGSMGLGPSLVEARKQAYERLELLRFPRMHFRRDIGTGGLPK